MKTCIRFPYLLVAASSAVLTFSLSAQSVSVDFDTPTSITDNLNKGNRINSTSDGYSGMGDITSSAGTGLGGSASGDAPPATSDIFAYSTDTAFDGAFTSATMGTYVQIKDHVLTGGALSLTMGFNSLATVEIGDGGSTGSSTGIPRPVTLNDGNQYSFSVVLRGTSASGSDGINDSYSFSTYNNGSNSGLDGSGSATLAIGSWYYWETNIIHTGDNYSINAQLFTSDSSGTISGEALIDYDIDIENGSLSGSEDIYGYIASQNGDRRGIDRIDNLSFNAIPEPSVYVGIFGCVALAVAGSRRFRG